jgi:isopenicillin N synthase-like dioxygenase
LRYPPAAPDTDASKPVVAAGEHTDYDNLTLLAVDGGAPGLQVRRRSDGAWVDVTPPPGVFVCNVADCLMRWTNDVYTSTPHRVILRSRIDGSSALHGASERFSAALFLGSRSETPVECLPSCISSAAGAKYPPTTAGEHLRQRLIATYPHLQNGQQATHL